MQNFVIQSNTPDMYQVFNSFESKLLYNKLNCCRVGIVESFNPETMEVRVQIANKMVVSINEDGTQNLVDYPPLFAKVYYIGGNDIGITYPLEVGAEGLILFNDREIESWYINGEINPLSYDRCHNITDCIFLCGLHSKPNIDLMQYIENCMNIYYKNSSIQIKDGTITINGNTTINGNLVVNGKINATGDIVAGGISLLNHIHGNGNQGADTTKPK